MKVSDTSITRSIDTPLSLGRRTTIVAVAALIIMVDSFALLALSLASPKLSVSWRLDHATLGLLLGLGPVGMALGSLFLAPIADRVGRRPVLIGGVVAVGVSMLLASLTWNTLSMGVCRVMTGAAAGALTPVLHAFAAEVASTRRRGLVLALIAAGMPIGSTLGGLVSIPLLNAFDWQAIFLFASGLTVVALLLSYFLVPESPAFVQARRSSRDLAPTAAGVAAGAGSSMDERPVSGSLLGRYRNLYGDEGFLARTLLICLISFSAQVSIYFILQWIPKILTDAGLTPSDAIMVSVLMNFGGVFGAIGFGFITWANNVHALTAAGMAVSFILIAAFPWFDSLVVLRTVGFIIGVAIFAVGVGLYTIIVNAYPTQTRVSGIGISIGTGRIGAVFGPLLAGLLISLGWSRPVYFALLSMPLLVASGVVVFLGVGLRQRGRKTRLLPTLFEAKSMKS
jgi:MFS family permease